MRTHERLPSPDDPLRERHLRARAAILGALESLRDAHSTWDDVPVTLAELTSIRRWIEGQTFAPRTGAGGIQLTDAHAARYGDFDEVHFVGLIEGEWPARPARNIFYPPTLLAELGWPSETERLRAARAAFRDLIRLPRGRVSFSTFTLEGDAIVPPSSLLEDIQELHLPLAPDDERRGGRIFVHEALSKDPVVAEAVSGPAADWLALRLSRSSADRPAFHGVTGAGALPAYTVGAIERYLECPFKYFAKHVLRIDEEVDDEPLMTPQARGRFLHEVFRAFFAAWGRAGRGAITLDNLDQAQQEFLSVAEEQLARLPVADRLLERTRLLGSPAAAGLAARVFRMEVERAVEVVERLLEFPVDGEVTLTGASGTRRLTLRGTADRVDLLADGTFRVIDYKLSRPPQKATAIQLPIYGMSAEVRLEGRHGRQWRFGEAGYIAFGDRQTFASLVPRGHDLQRVVAEKQAQSLDAIEGIERGEFPPAPAEPFLCGFCSYSAVCRKDYVGDE